MDRVEIHRSLLAQPLAAVFGCKKNSEPQDFWSYELWAMSYGPKAHGPKHKAPIRRKRLG